MIYYKTGGWYMFENLFRWRGSTYHKTLYASIPSGILTSLVRWCIDNKKFGFHEDLDFLGNNAVWTGFAVLVGFLVIFRTQQAYNRFLAGVDAVHRMRVEWFDACSALVAFLGHNTKHIAREEVSHLKALFVRLFSMLHAAALADIEDSNTKAIDDIHAFSYELLDPQSVDAETMEAIRTSETKPELIYYWINQLVVEAISLELLTIPPPIMSRFFQTIANGMVAFHEATKLSSVPFPFPYTQTCDALLLLHWILAPIVVSQWVASIGWCFAFSAAQVFVLWSLNGIANEIENPFGQDPNDLNCHSLQQEMNRFLLMLMDPVASKSPSLHDKSKTRDQGALMETNRQSFIDVWSKTKSSGVTEIVYSVRSLPSVKIRVKSLKTALQKSARKFRMSLPTTHLRDLKSVLSGRSSKGGAGSSQEERRSWQNIDPASLGSGNTLSDTPHVERGVSIRRMHSVCSGDISDSVSAEILDCASVEPSDIAGIPPELKSGQVHETDRRSAPRHDRTEIGNSVGRPTLPLSEASSNYLPANIGDVSLEISDIDVYQDSNQCNTYIAV